MTEDLGAAILLIAAEIKHRAASKSDKRGPEKHPHPSRGEFRGNSVHWQADRALDQVFGDVTDGPALARAVAD